MTSTAAARAERVYTIACDAGRRYVIYNASEIGNPPDHVPNKWYFRLYLIRLEFQAGEPFDTAESAELAARAFDEQFKAAPPDA